jgi:hypothetical protein
MIPHMNRESFFLNESSPPSGSKSFAELERDYPEFFDTGNALV